MYLVEFKDGGCRVSLRFHLFVSDGDPGNENFMCKRVDAKIFLCIPQVVKKGCTLEVGCGCVWNLWLQVKLFLTL